MYIHTHIIQFLNRILRRLKLQISLLLFYESVEYTLFGFKSYTKTTTLNMWCRKQSHLSRRPTYVWIFLCYITFYYAEDYRLYKSFKENGKIKQYRTRKEHSQKELLAWGQSHGKLALQRSSARGSLPPEIKTDYTDYAIFF